MRTFKRIGQVVAVPAVLFCLTLQLAQAQESNAGWNALLEETVQKLILEDRDNAVQPALLQSQSPNLQNVQRITVVPLDNDPDKAITERIKIALASSKYVVVERDDLDKILDQFTWNLDNDDMVREDTVKQLGNFLGVDALLYGRVESALRTGPAPQLGIMLKLVDVESTQLLWGKTYLAKVIPPPPPPPPPSMINTKNILIAAILIVLIGIWLATRPKAKPHLAADHSTRLLQANDLRQAIRSLRDASDRIGTSDENRPLYEKVKGCIDQLDRMSRQVENAPFGTAVGADVAEQVEKFDRSFASLLAEPKDLADRIRNAATSSDYQATHSLCDDLSKRATELENKFSERQNILRGS